MNTPCDGKSVKQRASRRSAVWGTLVVTLALNGFASLVWSNPAGAAAKTTTTTATTKKPTTTTTTEKPECDEIDAKRYPPRDCKPKCDGETDKSATKSNQAITTTTKKRGDDECDPGTSRFASVAPAALAIVDTPVFTG